MRMHSGAVGAQIAALRGVAKKQENSNALLNTMFLIRLVNLIHVGIHPMGYHLLMEIQHGEVTLRIFPL